jgi:hypothetical protein
MSSRRNFIRQAVLSTAVLSSSKDLFSFSLKGENKSKATKLLNAYYFRAHMYTIVPRHVREDLKWMADVGTDAVSLAILEQDLNAAVENVDIICNEAEKLNMKVFAVPSRWGGLVAGAPKVPSIFSARKPETWILKKDGSPITNGISGVISSIHHPDTVEFFKTSLDKVLSLWNIKGIVWDEPKCFIPDYSKKAVEQLGPDASSESQVKAVVDFFGDLNHHIKTQKPEVATSLFVYANSSKLILEESAKTKHLDYYGCDGRPWRNEDGGQQEATGKVLLGAGEEFLKAARQNGKKSLWLIENHNMPAADIELMRKRLPEVVKKDVDQLIYYYYPRNVDNPETAMNVIAKNVRSFKK